MKREYKIAAFLVTLIVIAPGAYIGIVTNFDLILKGLGILACIGVAIGLFLLDRWRLNWRDELHERWFMKGAETGVKIVVATVQSEADRQVATGKVTVETLKLIKATGGLDSGKPPLFLPGALTDGEGSNFVEGDFNVIHGLNDDSNDTEAWQ